jgi:glycosyltransferase involved in cell wall biosynthesis
MHDLNPNPCLSVVMPCYNELETIEECVKAVAESQWVGEIIIVDDGSTDGTREVLKELDIPKTRIVFQEKNGGKGSALKTGFQLAVLPYVIVQDADLEYDPSEYGRLLLPLIQGRADVVYGSRFKSGDAHRVLYFWHSVGNKFLTLLSNMFTNLNLTDMETCYKCFRKEVIQAIDLKESRFGIEPEITGKIAAAGLRVYEVGISYSGRTYDEGKKIGWRDGVRAVICIVKYSSRLEKRRISRKSNSSIS